MKRQLTIDYDQLVPAELSPLQQERIALALQACDKSYAPYSDFHVGAVLELEDGTLLSGANQENASYPCGTCAERSVLHYAKANHPDLRIVGITIAAKAGIVQTPTAVTPCGLCRQALLEAEQRQSAPIHLLLAGSRESLALNSVRTLLPFQFSGELL